MNTETRNWAVSLFIIALFFLYYNRKQLRDVLWREVVNDYGYTREKHAEFLELAKKERANQKKIVITVFVALLIGSGINWFVYQDIKNDYRTAQEAFYDGLVDGFSSACEDLFNKYSPSGTLYAYNETYTTKWCENLFNLSDLGAEYPPEIDYESYPKPASQYSLGFYAASYSMPKVVFTEVPFLCYGVNCANIATFSPLNKIDVGRPNARKYGVIE